MPSSHQQTANVTGVSPIFQVNQISKIYEIGEVSVPALNGEIISIQENQQKISPEAWE